MCELVTLKGGLTVPADALRLAWRLEHVGCSLQLDGDDLIIRPAALVSPEDRARIREWAPLLKAIVAYEAPKVLQ